MSAVGRRLHAWTTSVVLAATLVGVLLGGCTSTSPETPPGAPALPSTTIDQTDRPDARQQALAATDLLLGVRARAIREGDRSAFLATSDLSRRRFAARQRMLFANLQSLPVASFDYRTNSNEPTPTPELPDPDASDAEGDAGLLTISREVIEAVHLRRTDRLPVTNTVQMTFSRAGEEWLVTDERPARGTAVIGGVQSRPWGGAAVHVVRREALLVVIDDSLRDRADALADLVLREVRDAADLLGVRPRFRLLIDATSTGVSTRIGSRRTAALAVYFDVFGFDEGELEARLAGHRIKFHPRRVAELMNDRVLVRHELTHYLTHAADAPVPKWASEGLANYVSYFPLRPSGLVLPAETYDRAQARAPGLPNSASFGGIVDYVVAQAATTYLIDEFGMARFRRFLATFDSSAGSADEQVRKVLRRTYGFGQAELVRETWAQLDRFNRG